LLGIMATILDASRANRHPEPTAKELVDRARDILREVGKGIG